MKLWYRCISVCLGVALMLGVVALADDAAETTPPPPCQTEHFRQFDFWIGTWDLAWEGGTGTNVISAKLGDCVIEENFISNDSPPFVGNSVSVYDTRSMMWKQTWVDNSGGYLDFVGGMVGDSMILKRSYVDTSGVERWQRMVFLNITADSLDWHWQKSTDGEAWEMVWAIDYIRRK